MAHVYESNLKHKINLLSCVSLGTTLDFIREPISGIGSCTLLSYGLKCSKPPIDLR